MTWRTWKRGFAMELLRGSLTALIGLNLNLSWRQTVMFVSMTVGKDLLFWMNKAPSAEDLTTDTKPDIKPQ